MEQKIIASVLSSREHWEAVNPHMTGDDLTPEGVVIWKKIKEYYERDKAATKVDFELLTKRVLRKVKDSPKHKELIEVYLQRISLVDVSEINVITEVLEYKKDVVSMHLAESLIAGNEAHSRELIEKLQSLDAAVDLDLGVEEEYQGMEIDELLSSFSEKKLIRVAPTSLNERIGGGALRGHHILLAASPETGKSLFAIHMTHGFVQQKLKVLYIGNEDPIVSLVLRFISNLTGKTKFELLENSDGAMERAVRAGYNKAVFAGLSPGTLPEIRSLIVKHRPDVLVVDQLRNIQAKSENRTNQLETVARGMRDFARQYDMLVVSVTQAADSGRNELKLNMGDIDGSNVGMPGACDVMVMVGMNDDYYETDQRQVTLAKNKLSGTHDSWPVRIDKFTSRILDPIKLTPRPKTPVLEEKSLETL